MGGVVAGSGGGAPSGAQGQSIWSGGQGGKAPLKLKSFEQARREPALVPGQTTFRAHPHPFPGLPPPLPLFPFPSPPPPPPRSCPLKSGGPGVSAPGKFLETKIAVGDIWCILGELMMTYNTAIWGTKSLKNGVTVTASC